MFRLKVDCECNAHASVDAIEYALKAITLSGQSVDAEQKWQDEELPLGIKTLVLSVHNGKSD